MTRRRTRWLLVMAALTLVLTGCQNSASVTPEDLDVPEDVVARIVYFRAADCEVCEGIASEVIDPLQARCGSGLEVKVVDVDTPEGYEAFLGTETHLVGEAGRWDIPVVVVDEMTYVGDRAIRESLLPYLKCVFGAGGNDWPPVAALEGIAAQTVGEAEGETIPGLAADGIEGCVDDEEAAVCASPVPIFALYLTPSECGDTCDRTQYDLIYLKGVYPQLSFETRPMADNRQLADALAEQLGVPVAQWGEAPAVVVGDDYLVGEDLNLDTLRERLASYADTGATALWYTLDLP